ncbi:PREDICTED: carnitine O-acetyltransferase-like [Priapulus caudatus]|uniref:Carnitine O-acetyltransferase-like n=1 Tax=Priapulus caudatus TaxID=37621 RepID=A0ABM1E1X3_PRICU|nr:PREDICTED: carnitine O-acetyltransferase-like [Priapulus caudatus]
MLRSLTRLSRVMVQQNSDRLLLLDKMVLPACMYSHQSSLPQLPVPPLKQTLDRYILSLQPLLEQEEMTKTRTVVEDFGKPGGVGEQLQNMLLNRAKTKENWLGDWWLDVAYLSFRSPISIYSNPGVIFPIQEFTGREGQLRFAAKLIGGILDYKELLDTKSLPVDKVGDRSLCMMQYYSMMSSCRIPGVTHDSTVGYPADQPDAPRHIAVAHNNYFFAVPVYGSNNERLNEKQIYEQLKVCIDQSLYVGRPIGVLTTEGRNSWGKVHKKLIKDAQNRTSLHSIHRAIVLLCLDRPIPDAVGEERSAMIGEEMLYGGGSSLNSGNRWFDKTIQVIVGQHGNCGLCYEHSSAEGPPIAALLDHILHTVRIHQHSCRHPTLLSQRGSSLTLTLMPRTPLRLQNPTSRIFKHVVSQVCLCVCRMASDLDMAIFTFDEFGKDVPKSHKISPDAFIQMALQLAFYKLHGETTATYESSSLRLFKGGRTETIRSASVASKDFAVAMEDQGVSVQDKAEKLKKACDWHKAYTVQAMSGQAVDRHMLGLKLLAIENGMNVPDIFMDTGYSLGNHWRLSTSQVPSKANSIMSFGPVVPDGYGFCYNPRPESINICITANNSNPKTSSRKLKEAIKQSLRDMRDTMQSGKKHDSKL